MAFTCPRCGRTSHHPMDEREGYCGACHDWTGTRGMGGRYYDRAGTPIPLSRYAELMETDLEYRTVARTAIGGWEVSTVWLGLDHNFTRTGPPLIFETMLFSTSETEAGIGGHEYPRAGDFVMRYPSEAAALSAHDAIVAAMRDGQDPAAAFSELN